MAPQVKLWNQKINAGMETDGSLYHFKIKSKDLFLMQYRDALEAEGYGVSEVFQLCTEDQSCSYTFTGIPASPSCSSPANLSTSPLQELIQDDCKERRKTVMIKI